MEEFVIQSLFSKAMSKMVNGEGVLWPVYKDDRLLPGFQQALLQTYKHLWLYLT